MTHDLRTPLASIKAAVTSLLQVEVRFDPAQARELLQTVLEETDRLNRLVGNILGLAQVRSGALQPVKEPTALDEIVEELSCTASSPGSAASGFGRSSATLPPSRSTRS